MTDSTPPHYASLYLDGSPDSVVPESPSIVSGLPHDMRSGRPRWWRWLRRRPYRRRSPLAEARRTRRAFPVVALVPVPVIGRTPARVPWITWTPVMARGRLGHAADQPERGQSQPATHQHAHTPLHNRHLRGSFRQAVLVGCWWRLGLEGFVHHHHSARSPRGPGPGGAVYFPAVSRVARPHSGALSCAAKCRVYGEICR